jgi:hypothetical protein
VTLSLQYWMEHFKSHVESNMVDFQGGDGSCEMFIVLTYLPVHDFFTPQPVKNASIFLLRQIIHDWTDEFAVKILAQLRDSAMPEAKLVIVDQIIPYATESDLVNSIPGTARPAPPAPLLRNMGVASAVPYWADIHVGLTL